MLSGVQFHIMTNPPRAWHVHAPPLATCTQWRGLTRLSDVVWPDSVTWYDSSSDMVCQTQWRGVTDSVAWCDQTQWRGVTRLSDVVWRDSVTWCDQTQWHGVTSQWRGVTVPVRWCHRLSDVVWPDSATWCDRYSDVVWTDSVTWCDRSSDVVWPDSVTWCDQTQWRGVTRLSDMVWPESVTWWDSSSDVVWPDSVTWCDRSSDVMCADTVISAGWRQHQQCPFHIISLWDASAGRPSGEYTSCCLFCCILLFSCVWFSASFILSSSLACSLWSAFVRILDCILIGWNKHCASAILYNTKHCYWPMVKFVCQR